MKRSIKLFATLALSVLLFSCSDDPDTSPTVPIESPAAATALQGDWESISNDDSKGYTLHFANDVAVQKRPDGSVVRASYFKVEGQGAERNILYGENIFTDNDVKNIPNLFNRTEIISVDADQLVLGGQFVQTFKRADPVN